jgi:cytochrome b
VRVLVVVAVLAGGVAVYALHSALSLGFSLAVGGSGAMAMDELRFRPDWAEIRARHESAVEESQRRMSRFKYLCSVSALVAVAVALAAVSIKVAARKTRLR